MYNNANRLLVKAGLLVAPPVPDSPAAEPPAVSAVIVDAASAVETAAALPNLRDSFDLPPPALTGVHTTPLERSVRAALCHPHAG